MKSSTWRWATRLMGIGAFGVLLLDIGAGPAAAITPKPCTTCEPGEGGPPTPPPPPPPAPPPYSCQYDDPMTSVPPDVPSNDSAPASALFINRGTEKTTYAGWCSNVCPNASYKEQGPFGAYCDCYNDTIPQLRAAGVGNWGIHDTRYAIWSQPAPANTRTLIVALAGQNGVASGINGGGVGNITGQPNHWDSACNDWNCGTQAFDPRSFVGRLLAAGSLNITTLNTFAVSFLDHQYEYQSSEKDKIIRGLVDWLTTKVSFPSLKQIIIAGHSRGGCLTLGLVREFRNRPAYNQVRILGVPVDGTCQDNGEMGTVSDTNGGSAGWNNIIFNPLPNVPHYPPFPWYAWKSSFSTAYNNASVCIQNTVGGEPLSFLFNAHSFFLTNSSWRNKWIDIPHKACGRCYRDDISNDDCNIGGSYKVKTNVLDWTLRFVQRNVVLP